jgi:hypothetical protein
MQEADNGRWLLLIHQIPPKPNYLRVKIWRRLQRLGAVAIKNSVYALPKSDQSREDFQWVLREIVEGGGDGTLCEARLVDGVTDVQVEALFQAPRTADYGQIAEDARRLAKTLPTKGKLDEKRGPQLELDLARLKRRLDEAVAIDFFGAPGREAAAGLLSGIEARLRGSKNGPTSSEDGTKIRKIYEARLGLHGRVYTLTAWQPPGRYSGSLILMLRSSSFPPKATFRCRVRYDSICLRRSLPMRPTAALWRY